MMEIIIRLPCARLVNRQIKWPLVRGDGTQQTVEVHAGSGYLSQSATTIFFGKDSGMGGQKLIVRWPNGKRTTHQLKDKSARVTIRQ